MTVYAAYFSPTGNSRKAALAIASGISNDVKELDFTRFGAAPECSFASDDIIVIAAPVYKGRVYKGAMERFSSLKGPAACIAAVTYGNRAYDDALLELVSFMKAQDFDVVSATAVVGQHTYGNIQKGRPDSADAEALRCFGKASYESMGKGGELYVPGSYPYREGGDGGNFTPLTGDGCVSCGLCVRQCPVGAIGDDCRTIDSSVCISCFRCIRICPKSAKTMDGDDGYAAFAESFTEKLARRKENEFFMKEVR